MRKEHATELRKAKDAATKASKARGDLGEPTFLYHGTTARQCATDRQLSCAQQFRPCTDFRHCVVVQQSSPPTAWLNADM